MSPPCGLGNTGFGDFGELWYQIDSNSIKDDQK